MSLNVLVVDDSQMMRNIVIKTLRMSGVPLGEIHEAANGQEGLQRLEEHWIDIALVDINMPVMDGETMIDRMRENPATRGTPVVIVSTESSPARVELLQKKTSGFIHKPFTPESVRKTIRAITGYSDVQDD